MIVSLCLYKQLEPSKNLIFDGTLIRWHMVDKGTLKKSGVRQPHNHLSALLDCADSSPIVVEINRLFDQFEQVGGVKEFLKRANAPERWIRIEIDVTSEELRDQNLGPRDLEYLSELGLGLEFWFKR